MLPNCTVRFATAMQEPLLAGRVRRLLDDDVGAEVRVVERELMPMPSIRRKLPAGRRVAAIDHVRPDAVAVAFVERD